MPPDAKQRTALKLIHDLFSDDYRKADSASIAMLAAELFRQGLRTDADESIQYMALREALRLYAKSADADGCLRSCRELANLFAIDRLTVSAKALREVARRVQSKDKRVALAWQIARLSEELLSARRFAEAAKMNAEAMTLARAAKDLALVALLRKVRTRIKKADGLARRLSTLSPSERKKQENELEKLTATRESWPKEGHVRELSKLFNGKKLAAASGLTFSRFVVGTDRAWTYSSAQITVQNRSPSGRVPFNIRVRVRLLLLDGNDKYGVMEYSDQLRIAVKGTQAVKFSGSPNKLVRAHNKNSFVPKNAHVVVLFEGHPIYESLWLKDIKSDVGRTSKTPWWQDDTLVIKAR